MKEQSLSKNRDLQITRHPQPSRPELVGFDELFDHAQELHDAIAKRAYELFEHDGHEPGRALEHWLSAEKETLHPVALELMETDDALTLRAEVPGFRGEDLKLSVEPRRLAISGKREMHEEKNRGEPFIRSTARTRFAALWSCQSRSIRQRQRRQFRMACWKSPCLRRRAHGNST